MTENHKAIAAVALIEVLYSGKSHYLLLQRSERESDPWSGHLAFPGGRRDPSDNDLFDTCVRETREECGVQLRKDDLLSLLPMAPAGRSHNQTIWVQPWWFRLAAFPELVLDPREISGSFWVSKSDILDSGQHRMHTPRPGLEFPGFSVGDRVLWGFTYGVLMRQLGLEPDSHYLRSQVNDA